MFEFIEVLSRSQAAALLAQLPAPGRDQVYSDAKNREYEATKVHHQGCGIVRRSGGPGNVTVNLRNSLRSTVPEASMLRKFRHWYLRERAWAW